LGSALGFPPLFGAPAPGGGGGSRLRWAVSQRMTPAELAEIERAIRAINPFATIHRTERCAIALDKVLDRIEKKTGMKDLRSHIVEERILTPDDWRDGLDVFMGATFNLAHTLDQMLYLRPHNRLQGYDNLYLVGGGTHPGSGLPTIYESGRLSSNLLCDRHGIGYERVDLTTDLLV
jgi:phytoene dehydrogenase-like protein